MTVMWEAKAAPGRAAELAAWADENADAAAQLYRSADDRVVVIDPTGRGPGDAPADLLARPAHTWRFDPVSRTAGPGKKPPRE